MTSTATYGLAAKNPVVDMDKGENDYRWLMDKLPVDGLWSPELLKILRTYPGYAFHLLVEDPPNPPDIDRVRVCIDYEVLSATRIQFRLQNQQFGKYVFISLDGGKKYMDAGPWIQPVPEDPDAVILDLDRLPSEKHPKILDQNFKVLVAGTRMWSVHALIYAWGRGWEYPPDTKFPEPPKTFEVKQPDGTTLKIIDTHSLDPKQKERRWETKMENGKPVKYLYREYDPNFVPPPNCW